MDGWDFEGLSGRKVVVCGGVIFYGYFCMLCQVERFMQHTVTTSADGSCTLQLTQFEETYHSRNGAFTEAWHIYIQCGLEHLFSQICHGGGSSSCCLRVFDVGFGSGLNGIVAWAWQERLRREGLPYPRIIFHGIEKFPIPLSEIWEMNFPEVIAEHTALDVCGLKEVFHFMHQCPWEEDVEVGDGFVLHKSCGDIAAVEASFYRGDFPAVVFYDTFSPATQPELWDEAIFRSIADGCASGSVLVTYCSKGTVKQALRNAGFSLERLAGPPGKRHIIRGRL